MLIISGSNIPQTRALRVCETLKGLYAEKKMNAEIIDLSALPLHELSGKTYFKEHQPSWMADLNKKIIETEGIVFVVPEFNGSYPGALKMWIDHWAYPEAFKKRRICLIGMGGGNFGGLRPVDHLADVFSYGEAFVLPQKVYLRSIDSVVTKEGKIVDEATAQLVQSQVENFIQFCHSLKY
jgi:chromate reductase